MGHWASNEWKASRNELSVKDVQMNISPIRCELIEMTTDELCYSLTRFVLEVRKPDGQNYPSQTLYEMIISIQAYLATQGIELKLLKDERFLPLRNTLDTRMKELSEQGITAPRRQAEVITYEEEEKMWSDGILGEDTPKQLGNTVLYLLGLHLALRAGSEHYRLRYVNSQIVITTNKDGRRYLRYHEDSSKAAQGGLKHRKIQPKIVDAYDNPSNPARCIVRLYEKYTEQRPNPEKCSPALYLRTLVKTTSNVWYSCQRIGLNELVKTVKNMCASAGIPGFKSNHSLRATSATSLYEKGV